MPRRQLKIFVVAAAMIGFASPLINAVVSVYPTGTTIYQPDKTWIGFTLLDAADGDGAVLIDMNGNIVRRWPELAGMGPFRMFPDGYVMGGSEYRAPYQESIALIEYNWEGEEVWRFDRLDMLAAPTSDDEAEQDDDASAVWAARQHHDWQSTGNPVGYYSPELIPQSSSGNTLILGNKNLINPAVSDKRLEDDYLYEVSWDGEVLWEWLASDHIDEMGFSEDARNAIYRSVALNDARQIADWLHVNSANYLGPKPWYDAGDERFHPDHIMISSRTANIIAIIARDGSIVWRMGPDYTDSEPLAELGQIIGQHNPHLIPQGLPGAGNLLVFDNGGVGGYGNANPAAPSGTNSLTRDSSRVLEINPITFEVVWEYSLSGTERFQFYSWYVSNAQRLPNGNTMINEGLNGRIFELTKEKELVWEFVSPFFTDDDTPSHRIYRAYRYPYAWIPQLDVPRESGDPAGAG